MVDRVQIRLDDGGATLGVGLGRAVLGQSQRLLHREHVGQPEEAGLHDRVHPLAEPGGAGHRGGIDGVDVQALGQNHRLHRGRQVLPQLISRIRRGQQHGGAGLGHVQHRQLAQQPELVDGDEVGLLDQVRLVDRIRAEPQM